MKILFRDAEILGYGKADAAVDGAYITSIGENLEKKGFDRVIDCRGKLLMPGLYNCHTHAAMTLFRGYGEDMPLHRWLEERIFPAEELLTDEAVYVASKWAIAEMLRNGIVSFTDMYMFCGNTAEAAIEMGIKANIGRSVVSFDESVDLASNIRFLESKNLYETYHNAADGRIKIDMSLHAEYTNVESACIFMADYAKQTGTNMHIHLSETKKEHEECKERRNGRTPARFFYDAGVFDVPVTAAHCVWVEEEDIALMKEKGATAVHNPASNLKLGSGVMPLTNMLGAGVNVAIGTDGAASNNTLDILKEMYLAAILHKGIEYDPGNIRADAILRFATENGARAQGRSDCGKLAAGCRADMILIDLDTLNNTPYYDLQYAAVYSANSSNVCMTMVDGNILYENGIFPFFDYEKLKYDMRDICANYFKKQN